MNTIVKKKDNQIYRVVLQLAVPMIIQQGITNGVTLIDNVMVGSLGTEAITGVSIVAQLIFVFSLAIFGGLSGPGIYCAQYHGQGNKEGVQNTFRMKIWICAVCLVGGLLLFVFQGDNLIGLYLNGESGSIDKALTLSLAKEYLMIMLVGLVPFTITQVYAGTLRETGNSVKPMVAGIASVVVDIVFNYLLIFGNFGMPRLGVAGAALATVIARFVECGLILIWTHARRASHPFVVGVYKRLKVEKKLALAILKKSLPMFLNEFMWAAALAAMTQCYSVRGLETVAGFNISNTLCNLINVVFISMGSAVGIITGQSLGAGKFEKAKKDAFRLMWFTAILCLVLFGILALLAPVFPQVYDTTESVRSLATWLIIINGAFFPAQGFLNVLYFTLRSGGKTLITFLFDSVFSWIVLVPTAFILSNFTQINILGVYAIVLFFEHAKIIVGYILIRKGVWINDLTKDLEVI